MEIDLSKCELSDNQDGTKRIYRDFGNGYSAIYHRCIINEETGEVDVLSDNPKNEELLKIIEEL
jgi:hypothetical protein